MQISFLRKLQIILIAWIGLYSYLIDDRYDQYWILLLFLLSVFVCRQGWHKIKVEFDNYIVVWLVYYLISGVTIFLATDTINSLKCWLLGLLTILVGFMCRQCENLWEKYLLAVLYVFSGFIVLSIFCQLAIPNYIMSIQSALLTEEQLFSVSASSMAHAYAGITSQVGVAGYGCFIFIAVSFIMFMYRWTESSRKYWLISIAIGCIAMVLTGKRGLLGASFVSIVFLGYLFFKYYRKNLIAFCSFVIVGVLIAVSCFCFFDEFSYMRDRIISMSLSGREARWELMWQGFLDQTLFGNGLGEVGIYEVTAHNEYLRSLYETGLVGTITYLSAIMYNFMPSFRALKLAFIKQQHTFPVCIVAFSVFVQVGYFVYAMSGNPLSANDQFLLFSVISSVGLHNALYNEHE